MGGSCQCCGYNNCDNALELHHLDPSQKEFGFGRLRASPKSLEVLKQELKKCVLVCSNCHREIHAGIKTVPENYTRMNEACLASEYDNRKQLREKTLINKIPTDRRKIKLSNDQLSDMLINEYKGNKSKLARFIGVSETAIRKRLKFDHENVINVLSTG
jgi:ribosomal protein L30E